MLGDSTAQAVGADRPDAGYVGQVRAALAARDGRPWRVVNLSCSGATARDVLVEQLPALAALGLEADLLTCGIGANDLLHTPLPRLRSTLRAVAAALPPAAVVLTVPCPPFALGRLYVRRVNAVIEAAARRHGLRVADVSAHFAPPWEGKFSADRYHPSAAGYGAWSAALLASLAQP